MDMIDTALAVNRDPDAGKNLILSNATAEAYAALETSMELALQTYSNVHRGTGYNSWLTTRLYEEARRIILNELGIDQDRFTVLFCTPARADALHARLEPSPSMVISSKDLGLPLGLRAMVVSKDALPKGAPSQTGGGTTKIVSRRSVIWEDAPDRFEAGTPGIVNAITLARAIQIARRFGRGVFQALPRIKATASEILHQDDLTAFSGRELVRRLRQSVVGRGRSVPTAGGSSSFVNLDNSASTPAFVPVWETVRRALRLPEDQRRWGSQGPRPWSKPLKWSLLQGK